MRRLLLALALVINSAVWAGAFEDGIAAYEKKDYATAVEKFMVAAEQGHANAQYNLGLMYANGQGVEQNYAEAIRWLKLAAAQGLTEASARSSLWSMANKLEAAQGSAKAQFDLGIIYYKGQGVAKDYAEAARWYKLAADQGLAEAQFNLGFMYQTGQGISKDYAKAVRWYKLAAAQGLADAQTNLGFMYGTGLGVAQNDAETLRLFKLAVAQGQRNAQLFLGSMYELGQGVVQNYAEAVRLYKLAAAQGLDGAQLNLGRMYELGQGVAQNYIQAHVWSNLAAAQGDKEAVEGRDRVAKQMTPQQIAQAQKLATGCLARNYKGCD